MNNSQELLNSINYLDLKKTSHYTYIYSLFDRKLDEYGNVLSCLSSQILIRDILSIFKTQANHPIVISPEDYEVYFLGIFDIYEGSIHHFTHGSIKLKVIDLINQHYNLNEEREQTSKGTRLYN